MKNRAAERIYDDLDGFVLLFHKTQTQFTADVMRRACRKVLGEIRWGSGAADEVRSGGGCTMMVGPE